MSMLLLTVLAGQCIGVIGKEVINRSGKRCVDYFERAFLERARSGSLPPNHSLDRALRCSLAKATCLLAYTIHDPKRKKFLELIEEFRLCKAYMRLMEDFQKNILEESPQDYWLSDLISFAKQKDSFADFPLYIVMNENQFATLLREELNPALRNHIQNSFLQWVARQKIRSSCKPEKFDEYVKEGWPKPTAENERITFYEVFCIFFREEIKANEPVYRAFTGAVLAEMKDRVSELQTALPSIAERAKLNDALMELGSFKAFQQRAEEMQQTIFGELRAIKADTAIIKADTAAITKSLDQHGVALSSLSSDMEGISRSLQRLVVREPPMRIEYPEVSASNMGRLKPEAERGRLDLLEMGTLIGRDNDMTQITGLLTERRLVTVLGTGGVGKTRLAAEFMRSKDKGSQNGKRPFFVSFEELTASTEEAVVETLASALGLLIGMGESPLQVLSRYLDDLATILVLDNCETARENIAKVARILIKQCPSLRILATSRQVLDLPGIEQVYRLGPLSVPDSHVTQLTELKTYDCYTLFLERIQSRDAEWSPAPDEVANLVEILNLTDGLPMAIELVAPWVHYQTLSMIADSLKNTPLGPVTSNDAASVDDKRHQSMQRCLEWSMTCLKATDENCVEGFIRLGIFEGSFTLVAVEKICDIGQAHALLRRLDDASLIQVLSSKRPPRYRLLNLTRVFAREKMLVMRLDQVLKRRHVAYYGEMAIGSFVKGNKNLSPQCSVADDWPDMLVAAYAPASAETARYVWSISHLLGPFLHKRGFWDERERLCRAAVSASMGGGAYARTLIDLGITLEFKGKREEAEKQYLASSNFVRRQKIVNKSHLALALQRLCRVRIKLGMIDAAESALEELENVTEGLVNLKIKAKTMDAIARVHEELGRCDKAGKIRNTSLLLRTSLVDDEEGVARSWRSLGEGCLRRGDMGKAENLLRQSFGFWQTKGNTWEQGVDMCSLAKVLCGQLGREQEGLDYFKKSAACFPDEPKRRSLTLCHYGQALLDQAMYESALKVFEEARILCGNRDPEGAGWAWGGIAKIYIATEEWDKGLGALENSRVFQTNAHDFQGLAISWERTALIHSHQKKWGLAIEGYRKSLECSRKTKECRMTAQTLGNVALLYAAQGDRDSTLKWLDDQIKFMKENKLGHKAYARQIGLRSAVEEHMLPGKPWKSWQASVFESRQVLMRKLPDGIRKLKDPQRLVSAYLSMFSKCLKEGRELDAALALAELGGAYRRAEDFARAEAAITKAMRMFDQFSEPLGNAVCWHKYGDLYAAQKKWPEAAAAYTKSIEIKMFYNDDVGAVISRDALAKVHILEGNISEAHASLNESYEFIRSHGTRPQMWRTLGQFLWLHLFLKNKISAVEIARELATGVADDARQSETVGEVLSFLGNDALDRARALIESEGFGLGDLESGARKT